MSHDDFHISGIARLLHLRHEKMISFSILLIVTVILVSWGSLGHQTVGLIA